MSSQASPSQLEVIHVVPRPDELNMTESPGSYNVTTVTDRVTTNQVTTTMDVTTFTEAPVSLEHCLWILYAEFGTSNVRIWDVALLVPNSLFLLFLIFKGKIAVAKLRQTSSAVFFAFYAMVLTVAIISVARAVVSMMVTTKVWVNFVSFTKEDSVLLVKNSLFKLIIFCSRGITTRNKILHKVSHLNNSQSLSFFTVDGSLQTVSGQTVHGATKLLLNELGINPDFFNGDPCVNPNRIQSHRSKFHIVTYCQISSE